MRILTTSLALLCAVLLLATACGEGEPPTVDPEPSPAAHEAPAAPTPTRDYFIKTLREFLDALESGDVDAAAAYLHPFPDMGPADVEKALPAFLEKQEISGPGLDILAEKGTFGSLAEVFPERGAGWAGRVKADPTKSYAMAFEGAGVAALWTGKLFLFYRLDGVGKLK